MISKLVAMVAVDTLMGSKPINCRYMNVDIFFRRDVLDILLSMPLVIKSA